MFLVSCFQILLEESGRKVQRSNANNIYADPARLSYVGIDNHFIFGQQHSPFWNFCHINVCSSRVTVVNGGATATT